MADNQSFPPPANQGGQTPQSDVPQIQNPPNPHPARQSTSNLIPNPAAAARARTGGASYIHASLDNPSRPAIRRGNLQNLPADPRAAGQPDVQNLPVQEQPMENREVLNIEDSPDFPNQHRDQTEQAEMAALARQRQLLEEILATERRMMVLGQKDQARQTNMATSKGSLGRNQISFAPPQHPAVSQTGESEHVRPMGAAPKRRNFKDEREESQEEISLPLKKRATKRASYAAQQPTQVPEGSESVKRSFREQKARKSTEDLAEVIRQAVESAVKPYQEEMATLKKQMELSSREKGGFLDDQVKVFSQWIQDTPPIGGLNPQNFCKYNGKTNARDHLTAFQMTMHVISQNEAIWCKVFASTLAGKATTWFGRLPTNSINSWGEFKKIFLNEFGAAGAIMKDETCLFEMRQKSGENISSYITRFKKELDSVEVIEEKSVIMCFVGGMNSGPIKTELMLRGPKNRVEMFLVAQKMASAEDQQDNRDDRSRRRQDRVSEGSSRRETSNVPARNTRVEQGRGENKRQEIRPENFTALNTSREQIMNVLMRNNQLDAPQPMNPRLARYRDTRKRCSYHNDYGHTTEECINLKRAIQKLIDGGGLEEFRAGGNRNEQPRQEERRDGGRNVIRTITDETPSINQLKSKIFSLIHDISIPGEQREVNDTIGFRTYELATNEAARDQPLVIQVGIQESDVMRVLVDTGATKDILFYPCFRALGLADAHLSPTSINLEGFTNHKVAAKGVIELEVTVGEGKIQKSRMIKFVVIDVRSSYNAILGTPSQSLLGLVVSVPHQRVKFQTAEGIGCVRSNPKSYYDHLIEERKNERAEAKVNCVQTEVEAEQSPAEGALPTMDSMDQREHSEIISAEEIEEWVINPQHPDQKVKLGRKISAEERAEIIKVLVDHTDVFAWEVEDMQGISREVAEHRLSINPEYRPVQQRPRQFSGEKEVAIREEVEKLLKAGIIEEVRYPTWIANVVMVLKSNKKWRMCVDYTDLNKACPKDWYPLPRIDKLVDSISGHKILSFVDAYSGYHQIRMHKSDQIHTAFRAAGGIYCYKMMPFGLKNAGATYQRMVNKVFGDQIGRNVEAYIDDMVIKTKTSNHARDLRETFTNLRKNHMKLNPSKCAFGVISGKFLGFMVNEMGIEANPEKIKALINMTPPQSIRQIQQLNGRIVALSRFIARAAERCLPFFRILRGSKEFKWTEECDQAFEQLKKYLGQPPLLTSPIPGEQLYIYLAATDSAVAAALFRDEENIERPIYYVSHALTDVESRYVEAEKSALGLIIAARRLRAYFMAHSIVVYTNVPLKKILHRPEVSGRMLRWSIELTEFDINYNPRKAIRGQALADFIVETSFTKKSPEESRITEAETSKSKVRPQNHWSLFVDGSSSMEVSGAGILLISPGGEEKFEKAIRFKFSASNNQAEYEALIAGIDLALAIGVKNLIAHCDSQLVVKQIQGEYEAHHHLLAQYRDMARHLLGKLIYWELVQIDRNDNERADELSKLAADELENQNETIWVEFLETPAFDRIQIMEIDDEIKDWVDEMKEYIEADILPADADQARLLKKRSPRYTVIAGILYRRSFLQPLLRCVGTRQVEDLLDEVHKGVCGGHPGARTLADKIISCGYYWPSLRKDASEYVKKCDKCQRFADIPRLPAVLQTPVVATWPFDMWGLDLIGGLVPSNGGTDHLLVAVDYFSKWIEARPLKKITEQNTMKFVHDQIWCRFGLPRAMISDHGTQFSTAFTAMCKEKMVEHWQSSISHPEGNGQAEAANKLIISALKKTLNDKKGKWLTELPKILWSIRTTVRGPTGETPFALCYGSEAMIPAELNLSTARVEHYHSEANENSRAKDLDLLEERRVQARIRMINYKQKAKEYHDKKVNPRSFMIGDLVLRKIAATGRRQPEGKLGPNWEGPFYIVKIIREGTYLLCEQDGTPIANPWHADHLKKYYV